MFLNLDIMKDDVKSGTNVQKRPAETLSSFESGVALEHI